MGIIALLVAAIVGLIFVLNRSEQEKPANQNNTNQGLPVRQQ